jgi:hypothetical protein
VGLPFLLQDRVDLFWEFSAADPFFFRNPQQPIRSFLKILSSGAVHFPESSATDPFIFKNVQQLSRTFSGILSN